MLFNSLHFLVFFPIVTIVYFALPLGPRRIWLLLASFYFFCVFSVPYSLLLVWSCGLDYCCALVIENNRHRRGVCKAALLTSIICNLGTLAIFKYANFLHDSFLGVFGVEPWPVSHLLLPMGISFYTFQAMSYTIDVYRGHMPACRSLLDFGLFIAFFPQLVAGPIMRADALLPQFQEKHHPNAERMLSGVSLMVWGLLKKLLVADPMGRIVEAVYGTSADATSISQFSGAACLIATYAFAVQIYCDFSAYSDIAIGAGRVLGFRVMDNFNAPYLAVTIRDFWRRWHISLSTWLRDYLYIPLGGSRGTNRRTYVNLLVTMLLGGLWHGAAWTFVIWGALHGAYLAVERALGIDQLDARKMSNVEVWVRRIVTFHIVCLAWVFFRAKSAPQAFELLGRVVTLADGRSVELLPVFWLAVMVAVQLAKSQVKLGRILLRYPTLLRWGAYACLAVIVRVLLGSPSPEFIYFQF